MMNIKPTIAIDDFNKLDIRVGTIRSVDDASKTQKGPATREAQDLF